MLPASNVSKKYHASLTYDNFWHITSLCSQSIFECHLWYLEYIILFLLSRSWQHTYDLDNRSMSQTILLSIVMTAASNEGCREGKAAPNDFAFGTRAAIANFKTLLCEHWQEKCSACWGLTGFWCLEWLP